METLHKICIKALFFLHLEGMFIHGILKVPSLFQGTDTMFDCLRSEEMFFFNPHLFIYLFFLHRVSNSFWQCCSLFHFESAVLLANNENSGTGIKRICWNSCRISAGTSFCRGFQKALMSWQNKD